MMELGSVAERRTYSGLMKPQTPRTPVRGTDTQPTAQAGEPLAWSGEALPLCM